MFRLSAPQSGRHLVFIPSLEGHTNWWPPLSPLRQDPLIVGLSPVCLPTLFVLAFSTCTAICDWFAGWFYYLLLGSCVWLCLSEGPFLFLCVNFCFPVLCHLWSTLLPNGQQEEKSHTCTPEAVLSSPQLGSLGTTVPMLTQYKTTGVVVRWAWSLHSGSHFGLFPMWNLWGDPEERRTLRGWLSTGTGTRITPEPS